VSLVSCVEALVVAQLQMARPEQMAGIPRAGHGSAERAVSSPLIRGLSNNITNNLVELHIGSKVQTVKTDDMGRAEFQEPRRGTPVKATADVDGGASRVAGVPGAVAGGHSAAARGHR